MNRLKLLAAAALLAVPLINACGESVEPTPVGSITGQVVIEGEQQAGVTVKLNNGVTATTTSTGSFGFDDVEAGTYTLTISGFAEDGSFDKTDQSATIATDGQKVTVNFTGAWIRTSAVMGAVTVEGTGLEGVVVKLTGMSEDETTTSATGAYSFTGLRAGVHTVEISGFDNEDIGFSATSAVAEVAVGATEELDFQASYLRASAVMGQVTIEGKGLTGVTVSLQGVDRNLEVGTNSGGQFSFSDLRKGDYSVAISGYDPDEYGFDVTSQTLTVAYGETAPADFDGIALRTAAVSGAVTIEGTGLEGVTVSLTGEGADLSVVTNAAGQWTFTRLHAGSYAVGISGFDTDEYGFDETSANVTVALKETATVDFDGIMLRTAGIAGQVSIEGEPLAGITITVNGRGEEHIATTDAAGNYAIDRLHAGDYTVTISGFDTDEYEFEPTVHSVSVGLRETADIGFDGIMLRTVEIMGTVTTDGEPLAGVTVTISGGRAEETAMATTDMEGAYSFDRLHAGDYTVTISGFDTDEYEFESTSQMIMAELGEMVQADFGGVKLRTVELMGTVTTDGEPLGGVTVTITGGRASETVTAVTDMEGAYSFDRLHAGEYTVAVSGFDADEYEFDPASQTIMVELREMAEVSFPGVKLRTVELMGTVTTDGEALGGVTVTITGGRAAETVTATTDMEGAYSVGRLHAGEYTVTVSGFDTDEYEFDPASQTIMVELREMAEVDFPGIKLRTVGIMGAVAAEGNPLADVTVTVSGGRADEMVTTTTDHEGEYSLERLHAGDYTVAISGYDTNEFEFDPAERSITVELRETVEVLFEHGIPLRTGSISGRITMDGDAAEDITITLSGEQDAEMETDANGQYNFPGLPAGDYTLELSGFDTAEYEYTPESVDVTLMRDEGMIENFAGRSLRTVVITGAVTAEDEMIAGAVAALYRVVSLTEVVPVPGGIRLTDAMGGYTFDGLLDAWYAVVITGYDDEYDFPKIPLAGQEFVAWSGYVATDDTAMVNFTGTIIRTAMIGGAVTADGDAMEDVEVTIEGEHAPDDSTMMTDADGMYMFDGLRKGDYTISIANPDAELYDFPTTEREVNVTVGQVQDDVSFDGSVLRGASVSGQVHVDGHPLEDVAVVLSGEADGETTTDGNGEYNFPGLASGDYTVSITNPDADRYAFEVTETDVDDLESKEARIVDFGGEYVYESSISGMLYLDEVDKNGERDEGEPVLDGAAADTAMLTLEDGYGNTLSTSADSTGAYEFTGLKAGTYTLMHDTLSDGALYNHGYAFAGDSAGVSVELTGTSEETVDLPYAITKQTLNIGAVMANEDTTTTTGVAGVAYEVYPNLKAAQDGEDMLGSGTTAATGVAAVTFARADDYGPGGEDTDGDGVVIVQIDVDGSTYDDALAMLEESGRFEAYFAFTERTADATTAVRLVNTASQFKWSVTSADREVGGVPLEGWWTVATGGDFTHSMATAANGYAEAAESDIPVADIPKKYTVVLPDSVILLDDDGEDSVVHQPEDTTLNRDIQELWENDGALSYTHTGLELPDADVAEIGTISVNWTTQSLYLAFYREVDGVTGFTRNWVGGGEVPLDHRPADDHLDGDVEWTFRAPDEYGRFVKFEWDIDDDDDTDDLVDANGAAEWVNDWLVRFPRIPTDTELEIFLDTLGADKSHYSGPEATDAYGSGLARGVRNADGVFNTFGAGGGGHPEMWLCGESSGDITPANGRSEGRDGCVTYGYQWQNNEVGVYYWPSIAGHPYDERARLDDSMTVELKGIVPHVSGAGMTANVDTTVSTVKSFTRRDMNDGVYVVTTEKTDRYELDYVAYRYGSDDYGDDEDLDSTYLDTLFVFHQEGDGGDYDDEYDRDIRFKVSDEDPELDATLDSLTIDGETVWGFRSGARDGSSYEMTVGWDRDTIEVYAATSDTLATVTMSFADTTAKTELTGKKLMRGEGRKETFTVTSTVKAGGETETATYTVEVYRTRDRVKIEEFIRYSATRADTVLLTADDTVEVDEGLRRVVSTNRRDTSFVADSAELWVSLWAPLVTGDADVTVAFRDSTDWTFSATDQAHKVIYLTHTVVDDTIYEDDDGEDHDSTSTAAASGGQEGSGTLHFRFVDNDRKQFVGPTEISAIGLGEDFDNSVNDFRTPVVTTLGTLPMAGDPLVEEGVNLEPDAGSDGGVDPEDVPIAPDAWNAAGGTFNVYGDADGGDFTIEVDASDGGYDDVHYPDIDVNWVDSADYQLVVQTQAANIVPDTTRSYTTRVILWKRQASDVNGVPILDNAVVFDTLDLHLGCPEGLTCQFSDADGEAVTTATVSLTATEFQTYVTVTAADDADAGDYTVEFIGSESDEVSNDGDGNGYFIDSTLDEDEYGDEIERTYTIEFTVLRTDK